MARILLLSQDPTIRGGGTRAATVAKHLVRTLGHECNEAYVANLSHPSLTPRRRGGRLRWFESTSDMHALLAVLPELQLTPILSGRHALRRLGRVESWDRVLVVGGPIYHGAVASGLGLPVSVWGGTTLREERRGQWSSYGRVQGAVHRAALPSLERWERGVLRNADRVAAQSPYACATFERLAGRAVDLLYPPVPMPEYHGPDCRAATLGSGELSCIFVGRAGDPRKRFDRVLDVVGRVARADPALTVTLSVTAMLDELAPFTLPAGVKLRCLGYPDDGELTEAVSGAHWLLLTSEQEGFGFVVAEALACGTPVASTWSGGPEAMVSDSRAGFLADPAELAARIRDTSADDWSDMSEAGRHFAERTFSMDMALPGFGALLGTG